MIRITDFETAMGTAWIVWRSFSDTILEIGLPGTLSPAVFERYGIAPIKAKANETTSEVDDILHAVRLYFAGESNPCLSFWHRLDLGSLTEKQICVLQAVYAIPYGQTRTYADIAGIIGSPAAARFIGNTMAKNPFPIIIPCHRVIRKDGSLGGFSGGIDLKARMLEMERR